MKRLITLVTLFSSAVFANETAEIVLSGDSKNYPWYAIGAALAIGLPALGGALGQGRAAAAALEGFARNPSASGKIFVPMILSMALIESLVIFGLVIALFLFGKIG